MPIALVTGPANAGKARVVLEALRAHHARGEEPLLVVPTRADVDHYRRELARGGHVLGVRVERFGDLLAEVLRRAGSDERPIGRLARRQVLAAVLRRTAGERATPGVVRALASVVGELEVGRVTPARLRAALGAWALADPAQAPHARVLGELFEAYRDALQELTPARVDPERRAARALDTLRRAPALWGSTPVLMYGFDDFAELQLDAIETLGVVVGAQVTVSLAYEPGRTAFAGRGDTFQRLLPLASEHRRVQAQAEYYTPRARSALHHLERHLFEPDRPPPVSAGEAVRLLEGGGERAELELVAEDILGLLKRGVAPGEIAVAHRSPETIAELLGEVFRSYGIPFALERRLPFAHTAIGRALLGLLEAAFEDGEGGLGHLLAWLRAPGVLRRPELADALERQARRAGAHTAARARALWEAEHWPLEAVDRLREAADSAPATLIERAAEELERLFCAPRLRAAQVLAHPELPEARALSAGRAALQELGQLARSTPALAPGPSELIAILRGLELLVDEESPAAALVPHGAVSPGQSGLVAVLDPLALRARRVRALFLCGLQEGVFPAPARPERYLSEEERRGLAEASGLRLGRPGDALAAERYLLYAAVSRPEELLVLSWHTADDDGLPSARSLFVDDICDLFSCDLHTARTRRALGEVGRIRSAEVGAPGVSPADPSVGGTPGNGDLEASMDSPRPGIAPLRDPRVLGELGEQRLWSASGLQAWAGCPVRWFVERMLDARDLDPEAEPLARGGLAHDALRATLEGLREQTGSARLSPELLPRARELLHAALEKYAGEHPLSTAPERVPGVRRRLEVDLERYLEHAAACEGEQGSPLEPAHLELSFGFPEEAGGLPALDIGSGVLVRGRIDRVDLARGGEAVVYDYKSTRAPLPDKWVQERDFQIGIYMRAVEELLGARAVGGFYQPLSGRDLRARGVLAEGEGVELRCVRGDAREPAEVQELVGEVLTAARDAAMQARAGELRARPDTCGFGDGGCMYPSICRCER
jgi:ATP-dependent helicase/DNAse subunit B